MIPVSRPVLDGNEKAYLAECIDTGWISSEGPFVGRLERFFENSCGRRHGVAVCNGSAALDLALSALPIGPGDEVILPSFTIISCVQAILRAGAIPIAVDCDPLSWNVTAEAIEQAATDRTRAVMVVHIYGLPCDMDPILAVAARHALLVIEDAAEAIGLTYNDKPCGAFGHVATFSFYSNKLVATGEGGLVLTDDDGIAERLRANRNLCFRADRRFVHDALGWNMRMSNLQAAVGCAQAERLPSTVERKRAIGAYYQERLAGVRDIVLPRDAVPGARNVYWVFGIVLGERRRLDAAQAIDRLRERGIAARPFFWPIHEQPVLRQMGLFPGVTLPVSERLARRGFYLPSGPDISEAEQAEVVDALLHVLDED